MENVASSLAMENKHCFKGFGSKLYVLVISKNPEKCTIDEFGLC